MPHADGARLKPPSTPNAAQVGSDIVVSHASRSVPCDAGCDMANDQCRIATVAISAWLRRDGLPVRRDLVGIPGSIWDTEAGPLGAWCGMGVTCPVEEMQHRNHNNLCLAGVRQIIGWP